MVEEPGQFMEITPVKTRLREVTSGLSVSCKNSAQNSLVRPYSPTPSATCHSDHPAPPPSASDTHIKMRSLKQIEASRTKGARSRGPITAQGKRNSSRNSTRHGFSAPDPSLDQDPPQPSSSSAPVSSPPSTPATRSKPTDPRNSRRPLISSTRSSRIHKMGVSRQVHVTATSQHQTFPAAALINRIV